MKLTLFLILSFTLSAAQAQSIFQEDGSGVVKRWYYNPKTLDVTNEDLFFSILSQLGIKAIPTQTSDFVQDILFFDNAGTRLLPAQLNEVALSQTGSWTNSIWDYDHDGLFNIRKPIPESTERQLNWFFAEGGATISGLDKNDDPYILTTKNAYRVIENELRHRYIKEHNLWPTQEEILQLGLKEPFEIQTEALRRAPAPSPDSILEKISADLGVKKENIYIVESGQFLHIDTILMLLPGKKVLLDSVQESEKLIPPLELPNGTKSEVTRSSVSDLKKLDEIAQQLQTMGFEVLRAGGIWTLPDGRRINFFNGFQGLDQNLNSFFITNTSFEYKKAEAYFTSTLIKAGFNGQIHYLGKYHPFAGIDCMGAIAP